jgi:endo-1,3(4)-beta-glucanase
MLSIDRPFSSPSYFGFVALVYFTRRYFLYAAAIMARIDSTFIDRFGTHVDTIFHDVAHFSSGDSREVGAGELFFPLARHKSWFDGHSFATGMFPFGNGKSQESSSEAVNCYYGAYLWSLVRSGEQSSDMTDFARLLLAMEIRGAKTYWHMLPESVAGNSTNDSTLHLYTPEFEENYMVGNVGMLDVAANTWFGMEPLYVHMINAIPVTAITGLLFEPKYVQFEYPFLMKTVLNVEMAWRGYTTSIHSIIDPNKAWIEAQSLVSFQLDAAVSKTQVMYFISQRPGFNVTYDRSSINTTSRTSGNSNAAQPSSTPPDSLSSLLSGSSSSSSCESHPRCGSLLGECCPTEKGVSLDCCDI